jgi:hypothetical protein
MVPSVEKFLQVEIYGPAPTLGNIPSRAIHRLLGIASGTKTITRFREPGIEQGLQYLMKCLLDQAIQRTGNAQDAYPALRLAISTLRTAPGMDSPDNRACFIFAQCACSHGFYSRTVSPSTPGAPLFSTTRG